MATKKLPTVPRLSSWEKIILTAFLGLSGVDAHSKSDIASKLDGIQAAITELAKTLAVAVNRVEDHDRRLQNLEAVCLYDRK